jgi:hypothetical protein
MPLSRITLSPRGHLSSLTVSGRSEAEMVSLLGRQVGLVRQRGDWEE